MCLHLRQSDNKQHIATEDIVCYKMLYTEETLLSKLHITNKKYYAFFNRSFQYKIGKTFTSLLHKKIMEVEEGLHSIESFSDAKNYYTHYKKDRDNVALCEFIIPKGARYYTGVTTIFITHSIPKSYESFASDKIKFVKEIKI